MAEIMQKFLIERNQDICERLGALGGAFGKSSEASLLGKLLFIKLKASVFGAIEQRACVVGGNVFGFGDLFVRKAIDVIHHEDAAIAFAKEFDSGDEGFFHLHDLEHFFGRTVAEGEVFDLEETTVFAFVESVVGLMNGDAKDPSAKTSAFAIEALDVMEGAEHGFLGDFFGIGGIGEIAPYKVIHIAVEFEFGEELCIGSDAAVLLDAVDQGDFRFTVHRLCLTERTKGHTQGVWYVRLRRIYKTTQKTSHKKHNGTNARNKEGYRVGGFLGFLRWRRTAIWAGVLGSEN